MKLIDPDVCRCGVYKHLHPTKTCAQPRRSWWWHRHYLLRHLQWALWRRLPERTRYDIAYKMVSPSRDWCELVDVVIHAGPDYLDDYKCGCDAELPSDAVPPRPGWCYCPATEEEHAAAWAEINSHRAGETQ